jgi:hypothetical protein
MRRFAVIGLMAVVTAVAGCGSATRTVTVETHTVTHTVTSPGRRAPVRGSAPRTSAPLPALTRCGAGEPIGPHADCALIQAAIQRIAAFRGGPFHAPGLDTFAQNGESVTFNCAIIGHTPKGPQAPIYHCVSQQDPLDWFQFSFT